MKDNKNAFRLDISELPQGVISIKSPILVTKDQYELIQNLCNITERLESYIKDAVMKMVETDLQSPTEIGMAVCETLLKKWNAVKPRE